MDNGTNEGPRRRDAAATRRALLFAARVLMAQHGVEGTSTRDVAGAAGVNQALVYRYFGSKEKLFAEAAGTSTTASTNIVEDTPLAELPRALLAHVLDVSAAVDDGAGSISAFMTAANDETVREILRERIDTVFGTRLAARLDGPDAAIRAELIAAVLTGLAFLRGKIGTRALSTASRETIAAYLDQMAAPLLGNPEVPDRTPGSAPPGHFTGTGCAASPESASSRGT